MTVQAAGGGYTDSVILEVTVSAPNVAVTSPANGSVLMAGCSVNVTAEADATDGDLDLSTVTIYANGTSIGTIDYPLTEGEPTTFPWPVVGGANTFTATAVYGSGSGEVSVTSGVVTGTGGSLSLTAASWAPNPGTVGQDIYGLVAAVVGPGTLDGDGSGTSFAVYSWTTGGVWMSPDGDAVDSVGDPGTPFSTYAGDYIVTWLDGAASTDFAAIYADPGYYILGVDCTAHLYACSDGSPIATLGENGYVGGDAGDLGAAGTSHVLSSRWASYFALRPEDLPAVEGMQAGSGIDWDTEFAEAVASKNYDEIGTMIEATTDQDTASVVENAMKDADIPDDTVGERQVANRVKDKGTGIQSQIKNIVEHAQKLCENPNSPSASHWANEIKNFFTNIGKALKK